MAALARLRWQLAMIVAMVAYSPRMAAVPKPLLTDLVARSAVFGAIAIVLQRSGQPGVPVSLGHTLPFIVMPIVWRVRVSSLPHRQRRVVALVITVGSAVAMAAFAGATLEVRAAVAAIAVGVGSIGWRMGDPEYAAHSTVMNSVLVRGLCIGVTYQFAGWFPLLAAGQSLREQYWPGPAMFTYLIGIAISASVIKRWHATDSIPKARAPRP